MPRDTSGELRTEWKISLPATLAALIEVSLLDPITGRSRYGSRSNLIAALLTEHLNAQGMSHQPTEVVDA